MASLEIRDCVVYLAGDEPAIELRGKFEHCLISNVSFVGNQPAWDNQPKEQTT
jgi:hypothetical protein